MGRISPDYYCIDGSIPRGGARAGAAAHRGAVARRYGLRCANVFHAGDGNLHPLILYDANVPGELENTEQFAARHPRDVHRGGRHHHRRARRGRREDQPDVQRSSAATELAQFHAVKAAFDPEGLLNPGKAVPTLHRCAEYGAMRVKGGALPHPDLPRF